MSRDSEVVIVMPRTSLRYVLIGNRPVAPGLIAYEAVRTILQNLKRRARVAMGIALVGCFATTIIGVRHDHAFAVEHHLRKWRAPDHNLWLWAGMLLTFAAYLAWMLSQRIRCPNCGRDPANNRERRFEIFQRLLFSREGVPDCPYCGAALDVPTPP
jgi:hypothetical protein